MLANWWITDHNKDGRRGITEQQDVSDLNRKVQGYRYNRVGVRKEENITSSGRKRQKKMTAGVEESKWKIARTSSCLITLSCWSSCFLAPTLNVLFSCPQSHNPLIRVDFTTVKWQATVCCETGRALAVVCVFSSGRKAQGGREVFWGRQRWTRDPHTSEFLEDMHQCISPDTKAYLQERKLRCSFLFLARSSTKINQWSHWEEI